MSKGDKYIELNRYLKNSSASIIQLSFEQIEKIMQDTLPRSAYVHQAWWSNNYDHSQATAWLNAGYETDFVSDTYLKKQIVFVKS